MDVERKTFEEIYVKHEPISEGESETRVQEEHVLGDQERDFEETCDEKPAANGNQAGRIAFIGGADGGFENLEVKTEPKGEDEEVNWDNIEAPVGLERYTKKEISECISHKRSCDQSWASDRTTYVGSSEKKGPKKKRTKIEKSPGVQQGIAGEPARQDSRKKASKKVKGERERPYECGECDYRAATANSLTLHRRTHTGKRPFECGECKYKARTAAHLKDHMRTHTGEKPFKCNECGFSAAKVCSLKLHRRTHTGEKPYACGECEYRATTAAHLKNHVRTHTGEKPYECDQCDYKAAAASNLRFHKRTHTGEKPYECSQCDFRATKATTLKHHEISHTGEKPYECSQCGLRTTTATHLKIHVRSHTGEKPFECDECDYKAVTATYLKLHKRTHTGEKPYECDQCDYKAAVAASLNTPKVAPLKLQIWSRWTCEIHLEIMKFFIKNYTGFEIVGVRRRNFAK